MQTRAEVEELWDRRQRLVAALAGRHPFLANDCQPLPHQRAPSGDWYIWLLLAGRGAGKTGAAAYWLDRYMVEHPGHRGGAIAPTIGDAVESCYRGETGLAAFNPTLRLTQTGGVWRVIWPNGSVVRLFGAYTPEDVERLRAGGNRHVDWWEELAAWRKLEACVEMAEMGLRLGARPRIVASTTPKPRRYIGELLSRASADVALTRATMDDNPFLPEVQRDRLRLRYAGTRTGRQELGGEYIGEAEGALWKRGWIERSRIAYSVVPPIQRIVVALDPSEGKEDGDEQAIAVCARGHDQRFYGLHSEAARMPRVEWIRRAVFLCRHYGADRLVYEANKGGGWIEDVIRQVWENAPVKAVHASRGKLTRAEPVSALWEHDPPRASIVGSQPQLEDELCGWEGEGDSPNLLDALVWGMTELGGAQLVPRRQRQESGTKEQPLGVDQRRKKRREARERGPFGDQPDVPAEDLRW